MRNSIITLGLLLTLAACRQEPKAFAPQVAPVTDLPAAKKDTTWAGPMENPVRIRDFYRFMDSLAADWQHRTGDTLNDHILVMANPWIVDTLGVYQYETLMARDSFVYDQRDMIVFRTGDRIRIPDSTEIAAILEGFRNTRLDLNIPEFRLRIIRGADTLFTLPCRVGRNEKKYLAMAEDEIWLKTDTGTGRIIRVEKYPLFINPADNHRYLVTRRDDNRVTKTPLIPWVEPELNGRRTGDLIHPTTNPVTIGKAYSNGCVGVSEANAWKVYFYAPVGTRVRFRYDLDIVDEHGDSVRLKDIYHPSLRVYTPRPKDAKPVPPPVPDTLPVVPAPVFVPADSLKGEE